MLMLENNITDLVTKDLLKLLISQPWRKLSLSFQVYLGGWAGLVFVYI